MILVGIDDTDTRDSPGTNQLARALVAAVADEWECVRITRHQLLDDPRVPYTSKNGSASILLQPLGPSQIPHLIARLRQRMLEWFIDGSDPGLCVAETVPPAVTAFGRRCQSEIVSQAEARTVADVSQLYLKGLGGTEGGVIGALAAVGLAATGDDGRVVQIGTWRDDLSGVQPVHMLRSRGVEVRRLDTNEPIETGRIDIGKHLRPNCRGGAIVLFVTEVDGESLWHAVRLP